MDKPWSHSVLTSFETCPRRHFLTRVSRRVKEPESEAMTWGRKVHKAFELFALGKKPMPEHMKSYEKYVEKLFRIEGKRVVEARIALDKGLRPVEWMAPTVWVRGVIDVGVIGSNTAYLLDWKTGKRKPDADQMKLFSALGFAAYPWVDRVVAGFAWLNTKEFDKETYERGQVTEIWDDFLPRVNRLQQAFKESNWPPKPSGLCRKWCPVPKNLCEFSGE